MRDLRLPSNPMHLAPGGLRQLVDQALKRQRFIVCHDTLAAIHPEAKPAVCRGFYDRYSTRALRVIAALFGFIEVTPPR